MKEAITVYNSGYMAGVFKRTAIRQIMLFFCFTAIMFCSCGLETYYYLEPPYFIGYPATTDPAERTFKFETADTANRQNGEVYQGYEVYYRIYNSESRMSSDAGTISNRNTEYSSNGLNALRSLNYQRMTATDSSAFPLIGTANSNRRVTIRLFEEGDATPYRAGIYIGNTSIDSGSPTDMILRYDSRSFDFEKYEEYPQESDADVYYSSSSGTDIWYVQAYAVTYGLNTVFSAVYSQLLSLGSIAIDVTD